MASNNMIIIGIALFGIIYMYVYSRQYLVREGFADEIIEGFKLTKKQKKAAAAAAEKKKRDEEAARKKKEEEAAAAKKKADEAAAAKKKADEPAPKKKNEEDAMKKKFCLDYGSRNLQMGYTPDGDILPGAEEWKGSNPQRYCVKPCIFGGGPKNIPFTCDKQNRCAKAPKCPQDPNFYK